MNVPVLLLRFFFLLCCKNTFLIPDNTLKSCGLFIGTGWLPGKSFIESQLSSLSVDRNSKYNRDIIKTQDGCWFILKEVIKETLTEGEQCLLKALKEWFLSQNRKKVHPYFNGEVNGQREDQIIVPLATIKALFLGVNCPVDGPCIREMHNLEAHQPGTIVQSVALLKQRHNDSGLQLVRPMQGDVYDAVYETEEVVS